MFSKSHKPSYIFVDCLFIAFITLLLLFILTDLLHLYFGLDSSSSNYSL